MIMRMLCSLQLSLKSAVCSLSAEGGDEWAQIHQPPSIALNQLYIKQRWQHTDNECQAILTDVLVNWLIGVLG